MDHTEALPHDVLAGVFGRLSPRDLAVSRCVRRAWWAIVDRRRLLLLRAEDLPHSVEGIYANYSDHERPQFLGRPSTQHPDVDYGNLHFLPDYTDGYMTIADHCNGLLLYGDTREFCVVNPATRRWERLPSMSDHGQYCTAYLAFDPTVSPHYEVFLIPSKDLGLFDLTDCKQAEVPPEQLIEENFTLSISYLSKIPWTTDVPQYSVEWPTPLLTLEFFSSSTGLCKESSFARKGSATTSAVNVRSRMWIMLHGPSWRYSVY
jgi:hypothetical protein